MSWSTFGRSLFRVLFIIYCIEAGVLLTLAPWRDLWPRLIVELPFDALRSMLLLPIGRSLVTGFGLVHLVWGFHDLNQLMRRRGRGRSAAPVIQRQ